MLQLKIADYYRFKNEFSKINGRVSNAMINRNILSRKQAIPESGKMQINLL